MKQNINQWYADWCLRERAIGTLFLSDLPCWHQLFFHIACLLRPAIWVCSENSTAAHPIPYGRSTFAYMLVTILGRPTSGKPISRYCTVSDWCECCLELINSLSKQGHYFFLHLNIMRGRMGRMYPEKVQWHDCTWDFALPQDYAAHVICSVCPDVLWAENLWLPLMVVNQVCAVEH